jgi:hypothetical protein
MTADMQALVARQREAAAAPLPIAALDVPLPVVEAEACFLQAAARTHSPSDRIACHLDIRLEQHPELLATEKDYPGWAEHIAALQAANRNARKETP